jgi:hypothetical protein
MQLPLDKYAAPQCDPLKADGFECRRFGLNGADVLENVAYARAYNTDHQSRLLLVIHFSSQELKIANLPEKIVSTKNSSPQPELLNITFSLCCSSKSPTERLVWRVYSWPNSKTLKWVRSIAGKDVGGLSWTQESGFSKRIRLG